MAGYHDTNNIELQETFISEATASDYYELLKPRVMQLVVFTAVAGLLVAPGGIDPILGFVAVLCIAVGAGASGALNMWYDQDIDSAMSRTIKRPIPSGRVTPAQALGFGLVLSCFSVGILGLMVNWFSAAFLAFTIFFYAVVYTMWLKRSTPQNIVIGGAAGAFPPMIGWAAVTGGVAWESFMMFLIIFMWTPPHFWALALLKSDDYEAAGIPMMPNVAGHESTKKQIFVYSILLALCTIAPYFMGFAGLLYLVVASAMGARFAWLGWQVLQMEKDDTKMVPARKLFVFSLFYLFALFTALIIDTFVTRVGWL